MPNGRGGNSHVPLESWRLRLSRMARPALNLLVGWFTWPWAFTPENWMFYVRDADVIGALGCATDRQTDRQDTRTTSTTATMMLLWAWNIPPWTFLPNKSPLAGVVVSALALINEVNLRRARLVLRWATVSGFSSLCRTLISVCNQPATQGQLSLPSLWGR